MRSVNGQANQNGISLIISLVFLLVISLISIVAASNSAMSLKGAENMQDAYSSFQSAEAGIFAVLSLAGTEYDPFIAEYLESPFKDIDVEEHPLRAINDGINSVKVQVFLTASATECPRNNSASSVGLKDCEFYRVASEHEVLRKARTKVEMGVVKELVGSSNL